MPVTTAEFSQRLSTLQAHLAAHQIDLAVLNYNTDLYYYTGSVQPLYLLVPASGEPLILARKALTRLRDEVTHLPVAAFAGTKELVALLAAHGFAGARTVGFTLDSTAYATVQRFQQLLGEVTLADLSFDIRLLRMVKSPAELAVMTHGGAILAGMGPVSREAFHPGMTELELSARLEYYFRLHGHGSLIRCRREGIEVSGFGVCTSGERSLAGTKFDGICAGVGLCAAVPYGASDAAIPPGAPVVLDYAYCYQGYHLDMTRMACWGTPSDEIRRAYDAMCAVEAGIVPRLTPGMRWEDIYAGALQQAEELGYAETFMGAGSERVRFVGHGVGLELDEPPFLAPKMAQSLAAGMVVAIEPKVALPGIGVVGIENTYIIRETGGELITPCSPEIIVVGK